MATAQKEEIASLPFLHVEHVPKTHERLSEELCVASFSVSFSYSSQQIAWHIAVQTSQLIYTKHHQTNSCHQIHEDALFRLSLGGLCTVFRTQDMSQHIGHRGLVLLAWFITNIWQSSGDDHWNGCLKHLKNDGLNHQP